MSDPGHQDRGYSGSIGWGKLVFEASHLACQSLVGGYMGTWISRLGQWGYWSWLTLAVLGWADLPDHQLVVCSFRTGELELFAVDLATGDARNLTRSPKSIEKYPACSFAGDRVAFISDRDGTDNLYVMNADGSDVQQLTHEKPGIKAGMASWTADGLWLYFGLYGSGPPRMCRIHPDGSDFQVVGEGIDPAVSPDGTRIAFARPLGDGHHLFIMRSDGSDARPLTKNGNKWAG